MSFAINAEDVKQAAARIAACVHRTPVLTSRTFDSESGVVTFFKAENLQRGGAFKIRGASNFLAQIPPEKLASGVVAFSSGNHAQAVAIAARDRGVKATIVMPDDAPRAKVEATRGYGAEIVIYDRIKDDREAIGRRISDETGATLVPPYDHPWTMAGQGTAALELLEQAPDLDAIIAPVGGGGLLAGCATAAKAVNPRIRVFGAEPEEANDTQLSLRAGERITIPAPCTIADGLRAVRPGTLTFPIVQALAEDILLVSEDEIRAAMRFLLTRMKIVVEPSGAVPAAAVMSGKLPAGIRRIGVVLSGGNVDLEEVLGRAR